jgi:hypothetical protein
MLDGGMTLRASIVPVVEPRRRRRIDCGGEMLTVRELAARTGLRESGVYRRLERGCSGADLLRPRKAKLYEIGKERLSVQEIADRAGLRWQTVHSRLARGWRGQQLLIKKQSRRQDGQPRGPNQVIACKLAITFGARVPSPAEIRQVHPMSTTSAMRWRNALRIALEQLGVNA